MSSLFREGDPLLLLLLLLMLFLTVSLLSSLSLGWDWKGKPVGSSNGGARLKVKYDPKPCRRRLKMKYEARPQVGVEGKTKSGPTGKTTNKQKKKSKQTSNNGNKKLRIGKENMA